MGKKALIQFPKRKYPLISTGVTPSLRSGDGRDGALRNGYLVIQPLSKRCASRKKTALFVGVSEKELKFQKQILKTC